MPETIEINLLGDTQKEQWLNAINIFELCIKSNCDKAYDLAIDPQQIACIDTAIDITGKFADEMRRLVEGVCK